MSNCVGVPLSEASSVNGTLLSGVSYNAAGEEQSAALGNGLEETRGYDGRNRLTSLNVSGGPAVGGSPGSGTITVSGTEGYIVVKVPCEPYRPGCYRYIDEWDTGTVTGTVNGTSYTVNFGEGSTDASLAAALAASINGSAVVAASASGAVVTITARSNGSNTNYSLSASANSPFSATASGASLSGGSDPQPPPGPYHLTSVSYAPDSDLLGATDSSNGTWSS